MAHDVMVQVLLLRYIAHCNAVLGCTVLQYIVHIRFQVHRTWYYRITVLRYMYMAYGIMAMLTVHNNMVLEQLDNTRI